MEYNSFSGAYTPSLYKIYIKTGDDFDNIKTLDKEVQATYFHEYFHFIQDTTTVFGITQAWNFYDRVRQMLAYVQQNKTKEIQLPLSDHAEMKQVQSYAEVAKENCGDWNVTVNEKQVDNVSILRIEFLERAATASNTSGILYPILTVIAENEEFQYWFGAIGIIESMTAMIQEKHFGKKDFRDFPYRSAELIIKYKYPDQEILPEVIFAFCDVSLLSPYPSIAFFELLDLFQNLPESADSIYEIGLQQVNQKWPLWRVFDEQVTGLLEVVEDLYNHDFFQNDYKWFKHVIQHGFNLRANDPYLLLRLFREQETFDNSVMNAIKYHLGAPEVMNFNNDRWFSAPITLKSHEDEINTMFLSIYQKLHDFLLHGQVKDWIAQDRVHHCRMKNHCQGSRRKMPVDQDCMDAPWKKAELQDMCPFGAIYRLNGLREITFKFSTMHS